MTAERSKHPSSYRLSPHTKGQLEELARRWGMNQSEVLALLIDRAHREDAVNETPNRRVWVIEATSREAAEEGGPDVENDLFANDIDFHIADEGWTLVEAEYQAIAQIVRAYPGWRVMIPRDGKWIGAGGNHVYVVNARVTDDAGELYDALGLKPAMFDATSWDEVDPDIIDIPTF